MAIFRRKKITLSFRMYAPPFEFKIERYFSSNFVSTGITASGKNTCDEQTVNNELGKHRFQCANDSKQKKIPKIKMDLLDYNMFTYFESYFIRHTPCRIIY